MSQISWRLEIFFSLTINEIEKETEEMQFMIRLIHLGKKPYF
jgi:hypothetical protein